MLKEEVVVTTLVQCIKLRNALNLCSTVSYHSTFYHLFSFCGSLQDYKIHMDMELAKTLHNSKIVTNAKSEKTPVGLKLWWQQEILIQRVFIR